MSSGQKEIMGLKVPEAEAAAVRPHRIGTLLPQAEVEGQILCTMVHCPYCGTVGRCAAEVQPGSYFRCLHCGALFRT